MAVTASQIELVQESWQLVTPIADTAASLFYGKLFELDPELRALFRGDLKMQGKKLMKMLDTAVKGLGDLDTIVPAVQALGARHAGYHVREKDYDTVAEALLWTLGQGLGDAFTPTVKYAWRNVYLLLAATMKDAAKEKRAAA